MPYVKHLHEAFWIHKLVVDNHRAVQKFTHARASSRGNTHAGEAT